MRKLLQKIGSVCLMLGFGVSVLFYFFFDAQQAHYKLEAAINVLSGSEIEVVKLPAAQFIKSHNGDELWVNGKLYDIKSYTIENDTAFVSVYHDTNEEGLVKNLSAGFEQDNFCANDNGVHLSKYRLHAPDEGKILVAPFSMAFTGIEKISFLFPSEANGGLLIVSCVIKPPPDTFIV